MSAAHKPKAWNIKPSMTMAPSLWEGCVLLCPFNSYPLWKSLGTVIIDPSEVLDQDVALVTSTIGTAVKDFGAAGIEYTTPGLRMTQKTNMSAFLYTAQNGANTWAKGISEGHDDTYTLQAQHSSNLSPSMRIWSVNGSASANATTNVTTGKFHAILGTYDGNEGIITIDVDGIEEATASLTGAMRTDTQNTFVMVDSIGDPLEGTVAIAALWDRTLTVGERKLLGRDPFAMLRPAGF